MAKSRARYLAELLNSEGFVQANLSALAGADGVIDLDVLPTIPNSQLEHSSVSLAGHTLSLGGTLTLDTADIGEHESYLYYTNARARAAVSASGSLSYDSATGIFSFTERTDSEVRGLVSASGSLSYDSATGIFSFTERTDSEVRGLVSASGSLSYDSATGIFSFTERTDSEVRGLVSASGSLSYDSATGIFSYTTPTTIASLSNHSTDGLSEGSTNLYFTNARARAAISVSGAGSYDSGTGIITITGGVTSVNTQTGAVTLTTDNIAEGSTNLYYTSARANTDFDTRLATKSTTNLSEGTNLYYTDARVGSYLTSNSYATQSYVGTQIANLVDSAPATLDTLNELAAALGDDPNFATTVTNSIAGKVAKTGDTMTGTLTVPEIKGGGGEVAFSRSEITTTTSTGETRLFSWSGNEGFVEFTLTNAGFYWHITANATDGILTVDSNYDGSSLQFDAVAVKYVSSEDRTYLVIVVYENTTWNYVIHSRTSKNVGSSLTKYTSTGSVGGVYISYPTAYIPSGTVYAHRTNESARFETLSVGSISGGSLLKTNTNFGGDVSGTYNAIVVANDSHNHSYFAVTGISNLNSISGASESNFRPFVSEFQASNRSGSNYNGGFDVGTRATGYRSQFVFEANGTTTPPKFRNLVNGTWGGWYALWHNGNDGSGSGLDADLLDGQHGSYYYSSGNPPPYPSDADTVDGYHRQELMPYQSGNDFADGTLVTTNINSGVSSGDSFVIEVSGKAYGSSRPHKIIAEGYIYNDTIINTNGTNIGGSNFTYLKVMNISGNLSFWWPRHGYWNSYNVYVRSSSGGTGNGNRVTSISNSADPSSATKKIQIDLVASWTSANDGSGSGLDADLLDGLDSGSFLRSDADDYFTGNIQTNNGTNGIRFGNANQMDTNDGFIAAGRFASGLNIVGTQTSAGTGRQVRIWGSVIDDSSNVFWKSSNDGSGSGLDADTVDGIHASSFFLSDANDTASGQYTFTKTDDHAIRVGTIRGTAVGNQSGEYIHMYERVHIGGPSGWGASVSSAPTYGLSTYGGASLATNTGTVTIAGNTAWHAGNDGSGSGLDADLLDGHDSTSFEPHGTLSVSSDYQYGNAGSSLYTNFSRSSATTDTDQHGRHYYSGTGQHRTKFIPVDKTAAYRMKIRWKASAAAGTYIAVFLLDTSGNNITGSGTYWRYPWSGTNSPTSWTTNEWIYHASEMPSNAAYVAFGISHTNYGGGSATYYVSQLELEKVPDARYIAAGGASVYYSASRNARGYIGATETNDSHFVIATSGGEDIAFKDGGINGDTNMIIRGDGTLLQGTSNVIWHAGNDGSGSGLDADLLDGQHGSYYEMPKSPFWQNVSANSFSAPAGQYASVQFFNLYTPTGSGNQAAYQVPEDGGSHYHIQQFNGYSNSYDNWKYQIAHSFYTGRMYHRNQDATTWQGWATVWDSDSDGSGSGLDADLLDGMNASSGVVGSTVVARDGNGYVYANHINFNTGVENPTIANFITDNGDGWTRKSSLAHVKNQVRGVADGTWGISITGSAASASSATASDYLNSVNYATDYSSNLIYWQASSLGTDYAPDGSWYNTIRGSHGGGNSYYSNTLAIKMTGPYLGDIYTQTRSNGTLQGWNRFWHSNNDGSGSGLDADTVDGIQSANIIYGSNSSGTNQYTFTDWNSIDKSGFYSDDAASNRWSSAANWSSLIHIKLYSDNNAYASQLGFNTYDNRMYARTNNGGTWTGWDEIWHSGSDGSGSGLDADLLDGQHGSYYFSPANYPDRTNFENVYNNLSTSTGSGGDADTVFLNSRSGSFDIWSGSNYPSGTTHIQGIQVRHSTSTHYGWQIAGQYNQNAIWKRQITNSSFSSWAQIWTSATDGSGSGLDADLLDGYHSAENGASVNLRTASNGYLYLYNWINVSGSGLFSSVNSAHLNPNQTTSYGSWRTSGSRGGYDGIVFDDGGNMACMWDSSGNGGFYQQGGAGWTQYFNVSNSCTAFGDTTTSSSYEIYVSGAIYATGNITAYSDARIKENVVTIDNALSIVEEMRGVYYNKIDDPKKRTEIGFIAQEVNAIEGAKPLVTYAEDVDQYGVSYGNTTALLVEAIKELSQQVKDLKKELEELKNG